MDLEILKQYEQFYEGLLSDGLIADDSEYRSVVSGFLLFARRVSAYDFAAKRCEGRDILDIGCYTGYGESRLHQDARHVTAIDMDPWAIDRARERWAYPNVSFEVADARKLPFDDGTFDVVLAVHLVEHVKPSELGGFFSEVGRVLADGGAFITITPNRKFRLYPGERSSHPDHFKEYTAHGLRRVLERDFSSTRVMGIRAEPWIEEIERGRVNKSALRAYVKKPLRAVAESVLPEKTSQALVERMSGGKVTGAGDTVDVSLAEERFLQRLNGFSMDQFSLAEEPRLVQGSMDLFAIAEKRKFGVRPLT